MSVTFYEMAHSPFCIPIAAALRACGMEFERREVPSWDRRELLRLTGGASYEVPLLVDEGRPVFETGAETQNVARHVDARFAGGHLFPERLEGLQAIVIDYLENEVESRTFKLSDIHWLPAVHDPLERGMVLRHKERKFGRGCLEQWRTQAPALRAEVDRHLSRFESTLRHTPFLFGNAPVYSDFLLLGILGNFTYHGANSLSAEQHALSAWRERLEAWRW